MRNFTSFLTALVFTLPAFADEPINLIKNGNFEQEISSFTIHTVKGTLEYDELTRLGNERKVSTEVTFPTITEAQTAEQGKWYKVCNASGYVRAMAFQEDGNQFLTLGINTKSSSSKAQITQRIGSIDPSMNYTVTFKARLDHLYNTTAKNYLTNLIVYIADISRDTDQENNVYVNDLKASDTILVQEGWENYSLTFDIPAWKERVKEKYDFTGESVSLNFYMEVPMENDGKTFYNSVALDDIAMTASPATSIAPTSKSQVMIIPTAEGLQFNHAVLGDMVMVYNLCGQCVKQQKVVNSTFSMPLQKGVYCVKVSNKIQKVLIR